MTLRAKILAFCACVAFVGMAHAVEANESTVIKTEDGMYTQSWFLNSFLELGEDLAEAADEGKALVVIWEQVGCPYCEKLHTITIADPKVNAYMREHFNVLQLNKYGSRMVTDFDGEELEEREAAMKYFVAYTPTIQFFVADEANAEGQPTDVEALNVPGYLPPEQFYALLEFVKERKFREQSLMDFIQDVEGTLN